MLCYKLLLNIGLTLCLLLFHLAHANNCRDLLLSILNTIILCDSI